MSELTQEQNKYKTLTLPETPLEWKGYGNSFCYKEKNAYF